MKKTRQRNMREVVPRDIRNLLLDLLETRPLSMGDLDKLVKYLKERQSMLVDDQIEQKCETAAGESYIPRFLPPQPLLLVDRLQIHPRIGMIGRYDVSGEQIPISKLFPITGCFRIGNLIDDSLEA